MTIEKNADGSITITGPEDMRIFSLLALKGALKLECKGILMTNPRKAPRASKRVRELLTREGIVPVGRKKEDLLRAYETWLRNKGLLRKEDGS